MQRFSRARLCFAALVLGVLALCPPVAAMDDVIEAKVGLELLSAQDQQTLWRRIDLYAQVEAFNIFCGRPSNIERRVHAGIASCVTAASMQTIQSYFRKKLREHNFGDDKGRCETPEAKTFMSKIHAAINDLVAEVARMCKGCLFC